MLIVEKLKQKKKMSKKLLICLPGQRLSLCDSVHVAGQGTYERQGYIYSKLAGTVEVVSKEGLQVVSVQSTGEETLVPAQGDIVTAQVTLVNQQMCRCSIRCIGDTVLSTSFRGVLKKEDIRATEKDRVEVYKSFRPGDIILARVLPITEARTYHLSTAENELGVVIAHSESGYLMVPVSWTEMQCTKSFIKEPRKVAKVVPENFKFES